MSTRTEIDEDIALLCQSIEKKAPVYKLVLFNDDHHSMGEVVSQLCKAVKCNAMQAMAFMKEAHTSGSAIVKTDSLEECKKADTILREIQLGTKIEKE